MRAFGKVVVIDRNAYRLAGFAVVEDQCARHRRVVKWRRRRSVRGGVIYGNGSGTAVSARHANIETAAVFKLPDVDRAELQGPRAGGSRGTRGKLGRVTVRICSCRGKETTYDIGRRRIEGETCFAVCIRRGAGKAEIVLAFSEAAEVASLVCKQLNAELSVGCAVQGARNCRNAAIRSH